MIVTLGSCDNIFSIYPVLDIQANINQQDDLFGSNCIEITSLFLWHQRPGSKSVREPPNKKPIALPNSFLLPWWKLYPLPKRDHKKHSCYNVLRLQYHKTQYYSSRDIYKWSCLCKRYVCDCLHGTKSISITGPGGESPVVMKSANQTSPLWTCCAPWRSLLSMVLLSSVINGSLILPATLKSCPFSAENIGVIKVLSVPSLVLLQHLAYLNANLMKWPFLYLLILNLKKSSTTMFLSFFSTN